MVAMSRPDTSALAKRFADRFLLRLDNGALLGEGATLGDQSVAGPIYLPAERAFALGRLGPQHAYSLESKLQRAHKAVPDAQPLRSVSSGALKQLRTEAPSQQPAAKRPRAEPSGGTGPGAGLAASHRRGPPSPSSLNVSSWRGGEFSDKCASIVQQVIAGLGTHGAKWFTEPVNGTLYPEYYKQITQPMDLGTVQKRLNSGQYSSPKEFCEDMRLIWANCAKFNGTISPVGKIGTRGQSTFEQAWAGSGLSDEARARRATAGVAAPKYEPASGVPDKRPKKLNGQPSKSGGRRQSKSKAGLTSMRSTAHSNQPMNRERKQVLAETVQNLEESQIEDVMKLLRDNGVPQSETGECELDFDVLDNHVLWELDHMIMGSGGKAVGNGHLDSDTDSDSE